MVPPSNLSLLLGKLYTFFGTSNALWDADTARTVSEKKKGKTGKSLKEGNNECAVNYGSVWMQMGETCTFYTSHMGSL